MIRSAVALARPIIAEFGESVGKAPQLRASLEKVPVRRFRRT